MKTAEELRAEVAAKMAQDRFVASAGRMLSRALKITCSQGRDFAKKMNPDEAAGIKALLAMPESKDAARLAEEVAVCQKAVDELNARLAPKKAK